MCMAIKRSMSVFNGLLRALSGRASQEECHTTIFFTLQSVKLMFDIFTPA